MLKVCGSDWRSPVEETQPHRESDLRTFEVTLVKLSQLKFMGIYGFEAMGRFMMERVCHDLFRTTAVKNSDVSFRRRETEQGRPFLTLL